MGIVEKIEEIKDLGCTGGCTEEQIKEAENTEVDPALKTHLDDGDKLVWYKDPTIVATWHSNGKLDVPCFDATDVTISAVNFRILKGHWRNKDEHGVGTEPQHWLFNGRPISEYLELYPDFWKSNENKTAQPKKARQKKETSEKTAKTTSVINSEQKDIIKEYKYESEKLLFGSSFSGLYPDKLKRQATPSWVAEDMVDLLPDEVWRTDSKFLDIYCKSGIFLEIIINKLMEKVDYSVIGLYEPREIYKYIIENQIYAVCWNKEYLDLSRRVINGKASKEVNIHCIGPEIEYMDETEAEAILGNDRAQGSIDKAILGIDIRKEFFNNMQLDVVIGNPPYNNDIYIPFVETGHNLASQCSVFITPAKWQAKGGKKNEQFRAEIVPHMSKIVYYPDTNDVFDINMAGGVSYFSVDKEEQATTHIINKSIKSEAYNNEQHRKVFNCLNNILMNFLRDNTIKVWNPLTLDVDYFHAKIDSKDSGEITVVSADSSGEFYCLGYCSKNNLTNCDDACKYKVVMCRKQGGATISSDKNGMYLGTNKISILEPNIIPKNEYMILGAFNTLAQAKSLKSYLSTRLIQFIINASLIGANLTNKESWRFVPDPINFDHIFTDEELYKKYNLTSEEINIIESVIKERK